MTPRLMPGLGGDIVNTSFPTVENPIAQGAPSHWLNGLTNGNNWNDMQVINVSTGINAAVGSSDTFWHTAPVSDDIAQLKTSVHSFAAQQYVRAVAYKAAGYGGGSAGSSWAHEIEMHLHQTMTLNNITGYECSIGINESGGTYAFLVRWDGANANYTVLKDPGGGIGSYVNVPTALSDGDVMYCQITSGGVITLKQNNITILTATDNGVGSWSSGQPGMGMWPVHGADKTKMGWYSWAAGEF